MKQIIIVKPNTISKEDKILLKANKILVIEHPTPDLVRIVTPLDGLNADKILRAVAESAIANSNSVVTAAGKAVLQQIASKQ